MRKTIYWIIIIPIWTTFAIVYLIAGLLEMVVSPATKILFYGDAIKDKLLKFLKINEYCKS